MISKYFETITSLIASLAHDETEKISRAADLCAKSIAEGGVIHIHDTGHMLNSELVHRAGGLAGVTPFSYALNVNNPNVYRERTSPKADTLSETIALAIKSSNMRPGDVLFIGSVSGKSRQVVELALQAKAAGISVIAVTSIAYSSELDSEHETGKRLYEAADLYIDNHAPYGDALLEFEGMDAPVCPASGIAAACIMWAVTAGIVERLAAMGKTPTVFRSVNAPGGPADVNARRERYKELGY